MNKNFDFEVLDNVYNHLNYRAMKKDFEVLKRSEKDKVRNKLTFPLKINVIMAKKITDYIIRYYTFFDKIETHCHITNNGKRKKYIESNIFSVLLRDNEIEKKGRYVILQAGVNVNPVMTFFYDKKEKYLIRKIEDENENGTLSDIDEIYDCKYKYYYKKKIHLNKEMENNFNELIEVFTKGEEWGVKEHNILVDLLTYDPLDKERHIYNDFLDSGIYKEDNIGIGIEDKDIRKALKVLEKKSIKGYENFKKELKEKYHPNREESNRCI